MLKRYVKFANFGHSGFFIALTRPSTLSEFLAVEASFGGEAALVAAIEGYSYDVDGPVHRQTGWKADYCMMGILCNPLLLRYVGTPVGTSVAAPVLHTVDDQSG